RAPAACAAAGPRSVPQRSSGTALLVAAPDQTGTPECRSGRRHRPPSGGAVVAQGSRRCGHRVSGRPSSGSHVPGAVARPHGQRVPAPRRARGRPRRHRHAPGAPAAGGPAGGGDGGTGGGIVSRTWNDCGSERLMRSRMRTTVALWVLLAGVALTGCAEEDQKASVDLDGSGSVTPEPTQDQETSDEPREGELTRSDSVAATPKEKAISEVWFSYMEEMVRMLSVPDASPIRLRQLAVAGGVDGPQRYAEDLVERDIRLAGGMVATL